MVVSNAGATVRTANWKCRMVSFTRSPRGCSSLAAVVRMEEWSAGGGTRTASRRHPTTSSSRRSTLASGMCAASRRTAKSYAGAVTTTAQRLRPLVAASFRSASAISTPALCVKMGLRRVGVRTKKANRMHLLAPSLRSAQVWPTAAGYDSLEKSSVGAPTSLGSQRHRSHDRRCCAVRTERCSGPWCACA